MNEFLNKIRAFIKSLFVSRKQQEVLSQVKKEGTKVVTPVVLREPSSTSLEPVSGSDTQFVGPISQAISDIVIGFDFGTSTTKVVLRDPYGGRVFAVPFSAEGDPKSDSYLLPTKLYILPDGRFAIRGPKKSKVITNLKLHFIVDADEVIWTDTDDGHVINAFDATAIYMACVLQDVRTWFFTNCKSIYGRNIIRWHLNVGIPTVNYEEADLVERYKSCISIAWRLSTEKAPLALHLARAISSGTYSAEVKKQDIHADAINVYPEVAAEVAGYARSNMRENGLHLLVDIGAGTIDVSTFNLIQNDGQNTYVFMQTDVRPYGAYANHKERLKIIDGQMKTIEDKLAWQTWKNNQLDATKPVPRTLDDYIRPLKASITNDAAVADALKQYEPQLSEKSCRIVRQVVGTTKKKRDRHSRQWHEGLPVFICGGGSILKFYHDVVDNAGTDLKCMSIEKFIIKKLPKPTELKADGLSADHYHRMYVAYGLSYPYDEIGKIIPSKDVDDDNCREPLANIREAPSKDDV